MLQQTSELLRTELQREKAKAAAEVARIEQANSAVATEALKTARALEREKPDLAADLALQAVKMQFGDQELKQRLEQFIKESPSGMPDGENPASKTDEQSAQDEESRQE